MDKIRVIELFAGYGSQQLALKRLKHDYPEFDFEVVAFCEIDKYAIKAYNALHGDHIPNLGDITKVNPYDVPDCDLMTWSFPCTDISSAGQQKGLAEGSDTRSSLCWDAMRIFEVKRPKYLLMENVSALVSQKFLGDFNKLQSDLQNLGYTNFSKLINAKDMGVPQNRRRVFMVSILGGERDYRFPAPMPLGRPLKSLLERGVDEKYYIPDERVAILLSSAKLEKVTGGDPAVLGWTRDKKGGIVDRHPVDIANCVTSCPRDNTSNYVLEQVFLNGDKDGCASTVTTTHDFAGNIVSPSGGHKQMGVMEYHIAAMRGRSDGDWFGSEHKQRLEVNKEGVCNTLTGVAKDNLLVELKNINCQGIRIRRLSERELFRLMDVEDKDIDTLLGSGVSKTQLAKMAGNSIVVNVLYHIFRQLFVAENTEPQENGQLKLF